jgi:hypothetical protein
MAKSRSHDFTEAQLIEGCRRCIDNVKGLLYSALLLLGNKDKYQIPSWIFGKGKPTIKSIEEASVLRNLLWQLIGNANLKSNTIAAHYAKLIIGSNNLPAECSINPRGISISIAIQSGAGDRP